MKRFHALEWEDLRWFPASWRDYGTDYLRFIATRFDIYKPILPLLAKGIDANGGQYWVDCASGGGGGLLKIADYMKKDHPQLKIVLTDFYPNVEAFKQTRMQGGDIFSFESESIDATDLPTRLHGKFRTLFAAFHHFRPAEAKKILQNAVDTDSAIAVFEPVGRNAMSFISMLFVIFNVLVFTPFIRPVRWRVLPFIYLLPIIPLYIMWDGVASIFRIYSEPELREMVISLKDSNKFDWEFGKTSGSPMPVLYLLGTPRRT